MSLIYIKCSEEYLTHKIYKEREKLNPVHYVTFYLKVYRKNNKQTNNNNNNNNNKNIYIYIYSLSTSIRFKTELVSPSVPMRLTHLSEPH